MSFRTKSHITSVQMYEYYKKQTKESWKKFKISKSLFTKVLRRFHEEISIIIVEEGFEFNLFARCGEIKIVSKKTKPFLLPNSRIIVQGLKVDWAETKKAWKENTLPANKVIYHTNEHSNGLNYRWMWFKSKANMQNKTLYHFVACRKNKRSIAPAVKSNKLKTCYGT